MITNTGNDKFPFNLESLIYDFLLESKIKYARKKTILTFPEKKTHVKMSHIYNF